MIRLRARGRLDCDVVVAGGGPAGASAAARLAGRGYDVVLVDRDHFPRDKICGDFVGPAGVAELADLGVEEITEDRASNIIRGAAIFLDGERLIEQPLPQVPGLPGEGRVVPRLVLDNWLWRKAKSRGARTLEGHKVVSWETDGEGVTVTLAGSTERLRARLLLAADGSASTIARRLAGGKPNRRDRIVAVRAYYEDVAGPPDRCDLLFSRESFPGYYWLFPTGPGSANVGLGMVLESMPPCEARLGDLLERRIEDDPALHKRLAGARRIGTIVGWPLMTYNRHCAVIDDRLMLLGDAAGLINPINGEGIQYALESGRWAAETAARALAAGQLHRHGLAPYEESLRARMDYDMAVARLIVAMIRNRALNPLWFTALRIICARASSDGVYGELAGGILAGLVPAKEALSMLLIRGTVEQGLVTLLSALLRTSTSGRQGVSGKAASLIGNAGRMISGSTADRAALLAWGGEVASSGARLAYLFGGDLVARTGSRR